MPALTGEIDGPAWQVLSIGELPAVAIVFWRADAGFYWIFDPVHAC